MKKILAVLMVLSMIFALSACASKEYKDTVVTIPVTDENGEEVTDKEGTVVTEIVTEESTEGDTSKSEESSSSAESSSKETTKKSTKKTTTAKSNSKNKTSTSAAKTNGSSDKTTPADKEAVKETEKTTTETTTEKPKKRKVSVKIVLPYYNDLETKLSVSYKTDDDKKYTRLEFENPENKKEKLTYETVKLDGKTVKTYDLGEMKGDVTVKIGMTGVDITDETIIIPASESTGTITPVTGIEMMQGEDF